MLYILALTFRKVFFELCSKVVGIELLRTLHVVPKWIEVFAQDVFVKEVDVLCDKGIVSREDHVL